MSASKMAGLAAAVRDACARVAIDAYEDAGTQGLCAEGRFEAAVGAIERVDLTAIVGAGDAGRAPEPGPARGPARGPAPAAGNPPAPVIRRATREDLPAIVALLADDALGARRERAELPLAAGYVAAFDAIERDPHCELLVACDGEQVVGTLQLDFTPGLSRQGAWRATIEAVRVAAPARSRGTGRAMIESAIARAESRGCRLVQLTTDRSRVDAYRFYERLGFVASHVGMKLELPRRG